MVVLINRTSHPRLLVVEIKISHQLNYWSSWIEECAWDPWGLQSFSFYSISCVFFVQRHMSCETACCLPEEDVLCLWARGSVWEKGPTRSSVMPEHCPSPQLDGLCLLRGGNMRNGKSENFLLITSLREQNCGQKFPWYRQSWKPGERNRRNPSTLGKKTDNCNDKLHDTNR